MDKVHQLVDHHILEERGLEHHDTPVEAQGTVGCAAAPPAPLVPYQQPALAADAEPWAFNVDFGYAKDWITIGVIRGAHSP